MMKQNLLEIRNGCCCTNILKVDGNINIVVNDETTVLDDHQVQQVINSLQLHLIEQRTLSILQSQSHDSPTTVPKQSRGPGGWTIGGVGEVG